jgi:hypothetical protein
MLWTLCSDSVGCWSQEATAKIDEYARGMISGSGSTLFEELGLYYIGPIDGHNLELLVTMLQGMHLFPLCQAALLFATLKGHNCFPNGASLLSLASACKVALRCGLVASAEALVLKVSV